MSWLSDRWDDVKHVAGDIVEGTEKGIDYLGRLAKANFSDGHVGGTDPRQIWGWFHEGPDTGSYQAARATHKNAGQAYAAAAKDVAAVKSSLASGWHGPAGEAANGAISKVTAHFDQMQARSEAAASGIDSQVGTFGTTKHNVQKVPENPPSGGGIGALASPVTMVAGGIGDAQVVDYQDKAHGNQRAYTSYGGATTPQGAALPKDRLATPATIGDTGVDHGQVGYGHDGTGHHVQTNEVGGVDRRISPDGPGNDYVGYHPGTTSAQTVTPSDPPGGRGAVPPWQPGSPSPVGVPGGYGSTPGGGTGPGGGGNPVGGGPINGGPVGGGPVTGGPISGVGSPPSGGPGGVDGPLRPPPGGRVGGGLGGVLGEVAGGAAMAAGGSAGGNGYTAGKNGSWSSRSGGLGSAGKGGAMGSADEGSGTRGSGKAGGAGAAEAAERTAAAERAAARAGMAGKAGAAGRGGMGGPGAAGRGAKKEEDEEHKSADYLQNNDFADEVVGAIEKTAPPVIGE